MFSVEGSNDLETLTFISGMAYGLTYAERIMREKGKSNFYCLPSNQIPDSKLLLDIANESLAGDHSAEAVTVTIMEGLVKNFPCD